MNSKNFRRVINKVCTSHPFCQTNLWRVNRFILI